MKISFTVRFILVVSVCFLLVIIDPKGMNATSSDKLIKVNANASCHDMMTWQEVSAANVLGNRFDVCRDTFSYLNACGMHPLQSSAGIGNKGSFQAETAMMQALLDSFPRYTEAVLERFEKDKAVILFESLNEEMVVPKQDIPYEADVNTWFNVWTDKQGNASLSINYNQTEQAQKHAEKLINQLRFME
ncbi:hypothetical protein GCM10028778_16430 [Barrientosiimonas marina]|uniref:DUF3006 domain-containing protein n=1 Tax=Lentibacillus kimchii TaxID=1542911 RepID=A0ABW2UYU2_9BACI